MLGWLATYSPQPLTEGFPLHRKQLTLYEQKERESKKQRDSVAWHAATRRTPEPTSLKG